MSTAPLDGWAESGGRLLEGVLCAVICGGGDGLGQTQKGLNNMHHRVNAVPGKPSGKEGGRGAAVVWLGVRCGSSFFIHDDLSIDL